MGSPQAPAASALQRWLFGAAIAIAACQLVFGARLSAEEYWVTMTAAWAAALFLVWQRGSATIVTAGATSRLLGAVAAVATLVGLAATPGYRALDRILPLAAGAGMALAASGPRGWLRHRSELLLLALPVMNPLPKGLRDVLAPPLQPLTTWFAMRIDRAAGYAITADGNVLHMPNETLNVVSGCSGLYGIARLWVLAALVVALFQTSGRQRVALFVSAILIGFLMNAARIAVLAVAVMRGDNAMFDYWHEGLGATFFTVASTTVALLAWWQIYRRWRPPQPEDGAPCLVSL